MMTTPSGMAISVRCNRPRDWHNAAGSAREWRIGPNWVNGIIGGVIRGAARLDQAAHLWQKRRRMQ